MTITNYTIKQSIGQGGMASVYLAHDIKFQTNVAIKVLNKEYVHNDNIRKRFIAEARNMYKMSHPNIIKVSDLIDEGDTVAFVMEYIEGETLKEYLERKGKLSDAEIKNLFSQMLEAVGYVHEQNLVHRDIKPSNFMITPKGQIKLLDFGIAKNLNKTSIEYTITEQHQIMGTVMYMSPEQVKSTKDVTIATDIYSLGVLLWQMLSGRKPYNQEELSVPEIQVSILREPLPSLNNIWDIIIQKATEKNMDTRFNNCEDFKSALTYQKWKEEETIVIDNHEPTIVESRKKNDNYENTKLDDLHIDFFFPLKVKDCFTKIYNELQAEWKFDINWDVSLSQVDSYNWYYPETINNDFGIVGFSKNDLNFYFAYYSLYTFNSRDVEDYDFVFCTDIGWVPFSDINSIEDKEKIDAVLNDNVLLKFILEFILRAKKTDFYNKINDYKKFLKNNKLEFGAPKDFSRQWFNATDTITRSLIKWDVSTKPWDDVCEWQSHIAFQYQEYFICIGQFHLKQEWSLSVYSRNDLKIYSLKSLVKDNMNVFTNTYSLPKEVSDFIFNIIRMWIDLLGIVDKENKTEASSNIKNPTEYFTSIYLFLAAEVKSQIKWDVLDFPWIEEYEIDSLICFEINSFQFSIGQGPDGYCITGFNPKNNELYSANVFYPYLEAFINDFKLTGKLKQFILKLCDINAAAYAFSATAASKNDLYALFNELKEKHQLKTESKFYTGTDIPEKKKLNFLNKIKIDYGNINFSEFILLYDDTVFGKCDEGMAIVLSEEVKLLLLIKEGKNTIVATFNYNSPFLPRIKEFRPNYGKFSREIILEFYNANSIEVDCGIKHFAVNIDSFINELILNLI